MWHTLLVTMMVVVGTLRAQTVEVDQPNFTRDEIARLRAHVSANPDESAARLQLAITLTWQIETRAEGQELLTALLAEDASNTAARMAYAEVLSWNSKTFREAREQYHSLYQEMPDNRGVSLKMAQLLSWTGKLREAEQQYRRLLEQEPNEPMALMGLAEVKAWTGRGRESISLLNAVPDTFREQRWYLARSSAELAIGRRDRALEAVRSAHAFEPVNDFAENMEVSISDWRAPQIEMGASVMRGSGDARTTQLFQNNGWALTRSPISGWSRLEIGFNPTLSFNQASKVLGQGIGIGWEGRPHDAISLRTQFQAVRFSTGPTDLNGSTQVGWRLNDSFELTTGFTRYPLLDSVQAASGVVVEDRLVGRARANVFNLQGRYLFHRHSVDVFASGTRGFVTAIAFERNRQTGFDAGIGKTVRISPDQYLRLGYGLKHLSFGKDFGTYATTVLTPTSGGYFSPGQYFNHTAVFTLSGSMQSRWSYSATFSPGMESVKTHAPKMSMYGQFRQQYRISPKLSAFVGMEYMHTRATFERKIFSGGIVIYPTR